MKQLFILFLFISGLVSANAQETQHLVKDANAQQRSVGSFTGIQVSGAIDVYVTQSKESAVAVSAASAEMRDNIVTEVRGNTLYVTFKGNWHFGVSGWRDAKFKAYVSLPTLEMLDVSGASDVNLVGTIKGGDLLVKLAGASDIKGDIQYNNARFVITGASDSKLTGKVGRIKIQASGASDCKCYDLIADIAEINASGASDVQINVQQEISVQASGASSVNYKGSPQLKTAKVEGASSFSKKS
jgi:hypothetical protein